MPPLSPDMEDLYDGTGQHVGGLYPPIMVNWVLTDAYAAKCAERPVNRLIFADEAMAYTALGFVWMAPVPSLPLAMSDYVRGALVQALDNGQSIIVHADTEYAVHKACWLVSIMSGGGHA